MSAKQPPYRSVMAQRFRQTMLCFTLLLLPNILMVHHLAPPRVNPALQPDLLYALIHDARQVDASHYLLWLMANAALICIFILVRNYFLSPLMRIALQFQTLRVAYQIEAGGTNSVSLNIRSLASEVTRFTSFALDYYRKHQEIERELNDARQVIGQFALHQDAMLGSTGREIGTQYRAVLAYANHLEEQIASNKLDPLLRYDFDDVCESSFNLKLIAGALAMLSDDTPPHVTCVPLAGLMTRTMLALAPALDRRNMNLTTAEVNQDVAAHGDPGYIAHILWMMLLGMIRYAADESTLRMRCLHTKDGLESMLSIVVSELSPQHLSEHERGDHLARQLHHLTPHMFAESIRIHGNIQLADLLTARMDGYIEVLPLTASSCEICMVLPSAEIPSFVF